MIKKYSSIIFLFIFLLIIILISSKASVKDALEKEDGCLSESTIDDSIVQTETYQMEQEIIYEILPKPADYSEIAKREEAYRTQLAMGNYLDAHDYIQMTQDEFMASVGRKYGMKKDGNSVVGDGVVLTFGDNGMKRISIKIEYSKGANIPQYAWTLCGVSLFSDRARLEDSLLAGAKCSWLHVSEYAYAGLAIHKQGLEHIYISGDSEIKAIRADIDPLCIERLLDYKYEWGEKTYSYINEKSNVSIVIKYPVLRIPGHQNIADQVNRNIQESAFLKRPGEEYLEQLKDYQMAVSYQIENDAGDYISVRFDGKQTLEEKKIIFALGSTSNILEGGKKSTLDEVLGDQEDMELIEKSILETEEYSEEEKEKRIEQLQQEYTGYVLTPIFVYYFGPVNNVVPDSEECTVTKYVRKKEYKDLYSIGP